MDDQEQMGSVRVRTRTEVHGSKSSFRVRRCRRPYVGVDVMLSSLPDHAPLSSYRSGKSV